MLKWTAEKGGEIADVHELRSSIILFADGKDDHKDVMSYYTAIPQKDEEEARPYHSLYCVL